LVRILNLLVQELEKVPCLNVGDIGRPVVCQLEETVSQLHDRNLVVGFGRLLLCDSLSFLLRLFGRRIGIVIRVLLLRFDIDGLVLRVRLKVVLHPFLELIRVTLTA
jgi:hypothetical protein